LDVPFLTPSLLTRSLRHVMSSLMLQSNSLADTAALGAALADALPDGSVVALSGTLGAGKTQLVQAVAAATGIDPRDVTSPTFVLVNEYRGRRPIYHFDAYRIKDDDEFLQLGPEEYYESRGLTLIEWAERVESCLPAQRLEVRITVLSDTARQFDLKAVGASYEAVIRRLSKATMTQVETTA
jgi:tRNA threonylcarbamoyladenosine biosynthesis protein TsaE